MNQVLDPETQQALAYLMSPTKHDNETLQEFSNRKFHQLRMKKKLKKHRLIVPNDAVS